MDKLINHQSSYGSTPLYAAALRGRLDIEGITLNIGADTEVESGEDGSPLMVACAAGRVLTVKMFVAKGARTCYTNTDGTTRGVLRAAKNHPEIREWLLGGRFREGPILLEDGQST